MKTAARITACLVLPVLLAGCTHTGGDGNPWTEWERMPNPGTTAHDEPGTVLTRWLTARDLPAGVGTEFGHLVIELADSRSGTRTYRVTLEGLLDDALVRRQYELLMETGPDGWRVTSAHHRAGCRRGLSESGQCL